MGIARADLPFFDLAVAFLMELFHRFVSQSFQFFFAPYFPFMDVCRYGHVLGYLADMVRESSLSTEMLMLLAAAELVLFVVLLAVQAGRLAGQDPRRLMEG